VRPSDRVTDCEHDSCGIARRSLGGSAEKKGTVMAVLCRGREGVDEAGQGRLLDRGGLEEALVLMLVLVLVQMHGSYQIARLEFESAI